MQPLKIYNLINKPEEKIKYYFQDKRFIWSDGFFLKNWIFDKYIKRNSVIINCNKMKSKNETTKNYVRDLNNIDFIFGKIDILLFPLYIS